MTISNPTNKFRYEGNGVTDTFAFTGRIFSSADLVVEIITRSTDALVETLTLGAGGYSVTINGPESASIVVIPAKIPSGTQDIQLRSDIEGVQSVVLPTGTVFPAKTVETALDRLTVLHNIQSEALDRSIKLPITSSLSEVALPTPEASTVLQWNATADALENGPTSTQIENAEANALQTAADAATTTANVAAAQAAQAAAEAAAAGMTWRPPVRLATTANITLSGEQTIDGVAAVSGDRILVKNQTSAAQNGVYVCATGAWSRATDANTWSELISQCAAVSEGSTQADKLFICTVNEGGTLGTTAVTWSEFVVAVADNSVTTAKIADNAVTGAKIAMGSDAQGDLMYYDGVNWVRLPAGISGQFLKTNGAAANPAWAAPTAINTFTSSEQTITVGGLLTIAHPFSSRPLFGNQLYLVCKTAELGYSAGDYAKMCENYTGAGAMQGTTIIPQATDFYIRISANGLAVLNKTTGGGAALITPANWRLILTALGS